MRLTVNNISGGIYEFNVEPTETILDLKQKIYDAHGIHPERQNILMNGIWLNNEMNFFAILTNKIVSLCFFLISHSSKSCVLHLLIKLSCII